MNNVFSNCNLRPISDLDHHVLLAVEREVQGAVSRVHAHILVMADVENCFVHLKVCSHKVASDFILIGENEIVKSLKYQIVNSFKFTKSIYNT